MERRKALRQIGMSMGYVLAAPTFINILQSCRGEKVETWTPQFFTPDQGVVLIGVVDAILPKTDTPSASEANVHIFLDSFANAVIDEKQQEEFKTTLDQLSKRALEDTGKEKTNLLSADDLAPVMLLALKSNKKDEDGLNFTEKLRDLTVWAYKCNENVGEEVLAYLPLPGEYIPCGDVESFTGGKAWSL